MAIIPDRTVITTKTGLGIGEVAAITDLTEAILVAEVTLHLEVIVMIRVTVVDETALEVTIIATEATTVAITATSITTTKTVSIVASLEEVVGAMAVTVITATDITTKDN
jgi:hypothetical protein